MQILPRNRLLRMLSVGDWTLLQPRLRPAALTVRQVLVHPDTAPDRVYFVESGLISIIMQIGSTRLEVGMIGPEGLIGASTLMLGAETSPYEHIVQIAGSALAIEVADMAAAIAEGPGLRKPVLRFLEAELFQARQTAFVNASFGIEARLARWLLMCHDRVDGDELLLTHEVLAVMLGVQRPGVTLAVQNLEGAGSIRARRGRITILDRTQLRVAAGESYGVAEATYERLFAKA
ncbi:hypothetical protein ASF57_22360 [Methylobacterium sp. Leaf117]|nr:hypothetical protein ASF57_22360 [Methylobacterium sp. Leaf117]